MWPALLSLVALSPLISAHGPHIAQHIARANPAASSPTTAHSSLATSSTNTTTTANTTSVTLTFSLISTNPTAVPLSDIVSSASTQPTQALTTTWQPGSVPTFIPGAPALPNALALNPANYPALDKTPPTDSPEVLQWIQEVANTGIPIPDIPVTNPGGCGNNTAAVANATERCWWTCGGCTRPTDITTCPKKDTWGLTYDDGPGLYTPDLLTYFQQHSLHSTFFVVGSRCISRPAMLQDEYMAGHQIAAHTWSHPYMTTRTNEEVIAELGWSKKIIKDALGVTPLHWRPPFGDIDDRVRAIATAMNLETVIWTRISPTQTFDTGDYTLAAGGVTAQQVLNNWESIMGNSSKISTGFIALEHDLWQQTVDIAVGYILPEALAHSPSFNITPVIECLNMPLANAYVETNDNSTNPPPAVVAQASVSVSGSSGAVQPTGGSGSGAPTSGALNVAVVHTGLISAVLSTLAGAGIFLLQHPI